MDKNPFKKYRRLIAGLLIASLPLILLLNINAWLMAIAFLMLAGFFFALDQPKIGLLIFIFFRPLVDVLYHSYLITTPRFNFTSLFGGLAIIFSLVVVLQKRKNLVWRPEVFWWGAFLGLGLFSLFYTISPLDTVTELLRFFSIFAMFLTAQVLIENSKELTRLIRVVIFSAIIPILFSLWQLINKSGLIEGDQNRLLGTFSHPNMLAFFLILPIALATFAALNLGKKKVAAYGYTIFAGLLIIILALTYTRGAYLALAIIFLVVGLFRFRAFLFISLFCGLIFYLSFSPFSNRVNSIFQFDPYGSIGWRISLWQDGYTYFQDSPITGHGLGTASLVIGNNRDFRLGANEPHNDYLKIALENGILGLIAYLGLVISILWSSLKNFRQTNPPRLKMLYLFVLSLMTSLSIMNFGDNLTDDTPLQWSLWAILGGALMLGVSTKTEQKHPPKDLQSF